MISIYQVNFTYDGYTREWHVEASSARIAVARAMADEFGNKSYFQTSVEVTLIAKNTTMDEFEETTEEQ